MSGEFELQKALFSAVSGLGYRAYDSAPQAEDGGSTATFPYVEVGAIVAAPFDTRSELGFDAIARIHTRSRSAGMQECKTMQGVMYDRLHRGALNVTGFSTIIIQRENSFCDRMADGTFHGVCEYRVMIEKQ